MIQRLNVFEYMTNRFNEEQQAYKEMINSTTDKPVVHSTHTTSWQDEGQTTTKAGLSTAIRSCIRQGSTDDRYCTSQVAFEAENFKRRIIIAVTGFNVSLRLDVSRSKCSWFAAYIESVRALHLEAELQGGQDTVVMLVLYLLRSFRHYSC